ncbi:MAG TPA: DMT family transporter [Candidatus Latescibacteria bacterium]|nr:EamA family transporter [Gemmatimonadaceae bacterium]HJP30965.1 DMT family transporter [Candidatus Latescibacterota bacterium]
MNRHQPAGRPAVGLALGLFTALIWGTLPVILKILVRWLDVYTLTWFRFFVAGVLLLPLAARSRGLRELGRLRGLSLVLLGLSVVGLTGNYLTFMGGLSFVSPGTAQIVIQLSPVFMLLAGLLIFGESFSRLQWLGLMVLFAGMALFFSPRTDRLLDEMDTQGVGVLLIVVAAVLWGLYMVTQKQLLQHLRAEVILVVIYLGGSVLILPWVNLSSLLSLPLFGALLLLVSSVMTMGSYFTFARALDHVEASRIGVLVSMTPIVVVVEMEVLEHWQPGLLAPELLPAASIAGALLVVGGSCLGALGRRG